MAKFKGLLLALISIVFISGLVQSQTKTGADVFSNTISVNGGNYFLLGANMPWINYGNDFGKNGFGNYGVSKQPNQFPDLVTKGVHVVRWQVFADGRAGIIFDADGKPTGLDASVFPDLNAAVARAKASNIYLNLVFLDFSFINNPTFSGSVKMGGHSDNFKSATKRQALIDNVIAPVIARYGNDPNVLSFELMNEPEFRLSNIPQPATTSGQPTITQAQFWDFGSKVSALAHAKGAKVTVGSAALKWNKIWTNAYATSKGLPLLNLDYYQTHYYPWMDCCSTNDPVLGVTTWSPLTQNAAALNLDKSIVVGEIVDSNSARNTVLANGYAGYWPWSYNYQKTGDKIQIDWLTYKTWETAHASLVRIPASGATPTSTPIPTVNTPTNTPIVTPTNTPLPTVVPSPTAVGPTSTATNTPVIPTPTNTAIPTATNTPGTGAGCVTNCGTPRFFCDTSSWAFCDDYRNLYCPVPKPFDATDPRCVFPDPSRIGRVSVVAHSSTDTRYGAYVDNVPQPAGWFFNQQEHFHSNIEDGAFGIAMMREHQPVSIPSTGERRIHFEIDLKTSARRYVRLMLSPEIALTGTDDRDPPEEFAPNKALDIWVHNGIIFCSIHRVGASDFPDGAGCDTNTTRYYGTENVRDLVDVYVSRTHLRIVINGSTYLNEAIPDIGFDTAYLYLVQASYNPCKDGQCNDEFQIFHWDNVAFDGPVLAPNSITPAEYQIVAFNAYSQSLCKIKNTWLAAPLGMAQGYTWVTWNALVPGDVAVNPSDVTCTFQSGMGGQFWDGVPRDFEIVR